MKSMCHDARRNSPSVAERSPTSSCRRTTSRIASSSTARSSSAAMRPAVKSSRARSSSGGRSRLPTWSARKGGRVRAVIAGPPVSAGRGGLSRPASRSDLQEVGDHDVLVTEPQVVGVGELLDAVDLLLAVLEQRVEVEEREVRDPRLEAGPREQLGGPGL